MWLATVEAMAFAGRGRTTRRVLAGVLLAVALVANVAWSPSPLGRQFDNGWWAGPDPGTPPCGPPYGSFPTAPGSRPPTT